MALYEAAIVTGIAVGGIYALIAVGITQIYKVTRVLNLAHAGFVMWAAYIYSAFTYSAHFPAVLSAVFTVIAVSALGVVSEFLIFRFAERASTANKVILTFGLLQVLTAVALWVFGPNPKGATPLVITSGVHFFDTEVGWNQIANVIAAFVVVVGVGTFLRYTRLGLLTRATAEDAAMAELLGARRSFIGAFNWGLAAASAALAGIFVATMAPFTNDIFFAYFIFSVLATMLGGLQSLPLTALGGLVLGLAENLFGISGFTYGDLTIFGAIVLLAVGRRRWLSELGAVRWVFSGRTREEANSWTVSIVFGLAVTAAAVALVYATFLNLVWAQTVALVVIYSVAALSLLPVLGWTGQVSLATGGLMGIGGFTMMSGVVHYGLPLLVAVLFGAAVAALFGLALGVIVHRLSFVLTVIVTLAFNNVAPSFMGGKLAPWITLRGPQFIAPSFIATPTRLTLSFFVAAAVLTLLVANIRHSSWGTRFLAVKNAPVMAAHFGVRTSLAHIYAYGVSGAIAGVAGSMYVLFLGSSSGSVFGSSISLTVLLYAVVGGTMALRGPYLGAMLFIGLPAAIGLNRYGSSPIPAIVTGALVILLVVGSVDGLAGYARHPNESLPRWGLIRPVVRHFVGDPVDVSSAWAETLRVTRAASSPAVAVGEAPATPVSSEAGG